MYTVFPVGLICWSVNVIKRNSIVNTLNTFVSHLDHDEIFFNFSIDVFQLQHFSLTPMKRCKKERDQDERVSKELIN